MIDKVIRNSSSFCQGAKTERNLDCKVHLDEGKTMTTTGAKETSLSDGELQKKEYITL